MSDDCHDQGGVWADSPYNKTVCVCPRNSIFAHREADLALQITILVTVAFFAAFGIFVFIKTVKEAEDKKQRRRVSENDSIVPILRPSITSHGHYTRRETIYDDPKGGGNSGARQGSNGSSTGSQGNSKSNVLSPLTQDDIDDMYEIIPDNYVVAPPASATAPGGLEHDYRGSSGSGLLDIPVGDYGGRGTSPYSSFQRQNRSASITQDQYNAEQLLRDLFAGPRVSDTPRRASDDVEGNAGKTGKKSGTMTRQQSMEDQLGRKRDSKFGTFSRMKSSLWTSQNRSQHASGDTLGSHGSGADLDAAGAAGGENRIPLAEMHNSGTFGYSRGIRRFKKSSTPASAPVIAGNSLLSTGTGFGRLFASANTGGGRGMASSRKTSDPVFPLSTAGKIASKSKAGGGGGGGSRVRSGLSADTFMPRSHSGGDVTSLASNDYYPTTDSISSILNQRKESAASYALPIGPEEAEMIRSRQRRRVAVSFHSHADEHQQGETET